MSKLIFKSSSIDETASIAKNIGARLKGGEVFELMSDLGGGKTTFVAGLAQGFGSIDPVASPSFTINYVYRCRDDKQLSHFDFYRLDEAGVVANELAESISDRDTVVAVEWGDIVHDVLPEDRIKITIAAKDDVMREFTFEFNKSQTYLFDELNSQLEGENL